MNRSQVTIEEINQLKVLQTITSVYGQLAALWMERTRDSVLKSRDYLFDLHAVFIKVFSSYLAEVRALATQKKFLKGNQITFLSHNGKKVGVFIASNMGFYGQILNKTFELFLKDVREQDLEVTIIGRHGVALFTSEEPNRPYTFFDIEDEKINQSVLAEVVRHLVQYEEIRVYYGRFENFVAQEPVMFKVSADPYQDLQPQEQSKKYIFEPNIETILVFFEKQIFGSIFEQTLKESQLAKAASRIMVMDRAGENIKDRLRKIEQQRLKLAHQLSNQKQLNQLSSISLWRT